jgi:hypothetical protein
MAAMAAWQHGSMAAMPRMQAWQIPTVASMAALPEWQHYQAGSIASMEALPAQ